ncbi:MAG: hypothetical protein IJ600_01885 [Lachnospiraceae bacterium]|nr:hypothetical protein [Lachnospiraceae bacterium]
MDHSTLEELYQDIDLEEDGSGYTEAYTAFIRYAYRLSLALRKAGAKDASNEALQLEMQEYYQILARMQDVFEAGRLREPEEAQALRAGDERLQNLEALQPRLRKQVSLLLLRLDEAEPLKKAADALLGHCRKLMEELVTAAKEAEMEQSSEAPSDKQVSDTISERQYEQSQADSLLEFIRRRREDLETAMQEDEDNGYSTDDHEQIEEMLQIADRMYESDGVPPRFKVVVLRMVSYVQEFYYENMLEDEDRYALRDKEKTKAFISRMQEYLVAMKETLDELPTVDRIESSDFFKELQDQVVAEAKRVRYIGELVRYDRWSDWKDKDSADEDDPFQQMGMRELMEQNMLRNERQFFFMAMLENNEVYKRSAVNDVVMTVLSLDGTALPEEIEIGGTARNLREELSYIQDKAYNCAALTLEYFAPDADGKPRYLDRSDMDELGTEYMDLNADLMDFCDEVSEAGINNVPLEVLQLVRERLSAYTADFFNASAFVGKHANRHERNTVKPFNIYDLQGQIYPEGGDGLLHYSNILKEQAEMLGAHDYDDPEMEPGSIVEAVTDLTEHLLPEFLQNRSGGKLFVSLTREEIREMGAVYTELERRLRRYIRETSQQMVRLSEEEREFLKTAQEVHMRISRMARVYGLLDENEHGDRLAGDIEQYIDDELKRKQEAKEGGAADTSFYSREDACIIRYAMNCKQMMDHEAMLASFLFEDPQDQHGVEYLSRQYNVKLSEVVSRDEEDISKVPWTEGMRDLSEVPGYKDQLEENGTPGHIMQYATKNDWDGFMKVLDQSLRYMPSYVKKVSINTKEEGEKELQVREINVAEMIRKETRNWRTVGGSILDYMDVLGGFSGIVQRSSGYDSYVDSRDGIRISGFLHRLQRNLENAGFGADAQRALSDPHIPDGYNESYARAWGNELFGTLDRTASHNLMPEESIPLAQSGGKTERCTEVTIDFARGNVDHTSLEEDEFYTTVADFRASDFVGGFKNISRNMEVLQSAIEGLNGQEIVEVFSDIRRNRFDGATEKQITEARRIVRRVQEDVLFQMQEGIVKYGENEAGESRDTFGSEKTLADMADLQVMDYLCGVRKRQPEDLRLGFIKRDGKVCFTSITGADRPQTRPFTHLDPAEEQKLLTHPEDMMVMTADMYEKLIRWRKGLDDIRGSRLTDTEKEVFDSMDPEVMLDFDRRLQRLLGATENPGTTVYRDKKRALLGEGFAPDLKRGSIRVLPRSVFSQLHIEDLAIVVREPEAYKPGIPTAHNIYDLMAEMPQRCTDALLDKGIAFLSGAAGEKFGQGLEGVGEAMFRSQKQAYDMSLHSMMCERLCLRCAQLYGDIAVMEEEAKQKENALLRFFGDGSVFRALGAAAESMRDAILQNYALVEDDRKLSGYGEEGLSAERIEEIMAYRQERLTHAQALSDAQGHLYPEELQPVTKDPYLYYRSLIAMGTFRDKLREYLEKRKAPGNEQGKVRYAAITDLFNEVNRTIAVYAALSGDTTLMPQVAELSGDKSYSAEFKNMFASKEEYEGITPYYYETAHKKKAKADAPGRTAEEARSDGGRGRHSTDGKRRISLNTLINE